MLKGDIKPGVIYCDKWGNLFLIITTRLVASRSSAGRGPYQLAAHPGQRATREDRYTGRAYGYLVLYGHTNLEALETVDAAEIFEALEKEEPLPVHSAGYYKLIYTFGKLEGPARQIFAQRAAYQRTRRETVATWMQEEHYAVQELNQYLPADRQLKPRSYAPDQEPVIHLSLETVRALLQGIDERVAQRMADVGNAAAMAQLAMIDAGELVYVPLNDYDDED